MSSIWDSFRLQPSNVVDVGDVVKRLTRAYPLARPPKVSPEALAPLIAYLRTVTTEVRAQYDRTWQWGTRDGGLPGPAQSVLQNIGTDLRRWEDSMAQYEADLQICAQQSDDPTCAVWTIVAPLFFGFFGGAQSLEPQKAPDLARPFTIANQLAELRAWSQDSLGWTGIARDLEVSARNVAGTLSAAVDGTMRVLGSTIGSAAGGVLEGLGPIVPIVVVVLLWLLFRRRGEKAEDSNG